MILPPEPCWSRFCLLGETSSLQHLLLPVCWPATKHTKLHEQAEEMTNSSQWTAPLFCVVTHVVYSECRGARHGPVGQLIAIMIVIVIANVCIIV